MDYNLWTIDLAPFWGKLDFCWWNFLQLPTGNSVAGFIRSNQSHGQSSFLVNFFIEIVPELLDQKLQSF